MYWLLSPEIVQTVFVSASFVALLRLQFSNEFSESQAIMTTMRPRAIEDAVKGTPKSDHQQIDCEDQAQEGTSKERDAVRKQN